MSTLYDKERFIGFELDSGSTRDICKDYIKSVNKIVDSNSVFLGIESDVGVSLSPEDFNMILTPGYKYPTLDEFYQDIKSILNDQDASSAYFSTNNLIGNFTQEAEGDNLTSPFSDIEVPYVSGSGNDQIFDFSVLLDDRFNKNAYVGNTFGLSEYYDYPWLTQFYFDTGNPYHWKLTDFHHRDLQTQMVGLTNTFYGKFIYDTAGTLNSVTEVLLYDLQPTGEDLVRTKEYANILPTTYGDNLIPESSSTFDTDGTDWWFNYNLTSKVWNSDTKDMTLTTNDTVFGVSMVGPVQDTTVLVEFDAKSTNSTRPMVTSNDIYNTTIRVSPNLSTEYQSYVIQGDLKRSNGRYYFYLTSNPGDDITFDNMSMRIVTQNYYKNEPIS